MEQNGTKYLNVNPITHVLILSVPNFHTQKHVQYFLGDFKNHFRPKFHFYTPFSGGVKMEMA